MPNVELSGWPPVNFEMNCSVLGQSARDLDMETTTTTTNAIFKSNYQRHRQHLKLKGLQTKTIDAFSRAIRRIGERFGGRIDELFAQQLTDYFTDLLASHS